MGTQSKSWLKSFIEGFNKVSSDEEPANAAKVSINPVELAVEIAANLCRKFEGISLRPYICPAGYPTIGYGTVYKPDGTTVKLSDNPITKEQAEEWLILTIKRDYLPSVLKASPNLINYPRVLGAIVDFVYNLGIARYKASTLKKRVDAEDWEGAKTEILKWNKGKVKGTLTVLPGLVKRRKAEEELI